MYDEQMKQAQVGQLRARSAGLGMDARLTYRQQLAAQKQHHDERGADLARALDILDKHPEIEELLTIVGRVL